ncbi:hypothetical protein [Sediminicoccus sp. BL-A-41-H5]|jgi:hypothetical protein|uniref:hypothetical protein n=1 Tax=Sediminicoccus sp. BL-A-41-H5 TaxID=3421106 RepID=UPI003D667C8B
MFRTAIAFMLTLLAAAPASAQFTAGTACREHNNGEVRCAVRLDNAAYISFNVLINATSVRGDARVQADTYVSTCGSPGRMIARTNIANSGTSLVASFTHSPNTVEFGAQLLAGACVEVFLLNCIEAGRPTPCKNAVQAFASRVEVHMR